MIVELNWPVDPPALLGDVELDLQLLLFQIITVENVRVIPDDRVCRSGK